MTDHLLHSLADVLQLYFDLFQCLGSDSLTLMDEAEEDVLGADEGVPEETRLLLGVDEDPAGSVGEALERAYMVSLLPAAPSAGARTGLTSWLSVSASTLVGSSTRELP